MFVGNDTQLKTATSNSDTTYIHTESYYKLLNAVASNNDQVVTYICFAPVWAHLYCSSQKRRRKLPCGNFSWMLVLFSFIMLSRSSWKPDSTLMPLASVALLMASCILFTSFSASYALSCKCCNFSFFCGEVRYRLFVNLLGVAVWLTWFARLSMESSKSFAIIFTARAWWPGLICENVTLCSSDSWRKYFAVAVNYSREWGIQWCLNLTLLSHKHSFPLFCHQGILDLVGQDKCWLNQE